MGEYLVNKNSLGKTGLSYKSIGQIAITFYKVLSN